MTTFTPSEAEWEAGPLRYIESITAEASRTGIAHIVPPASWNPPALAVRSGADGVDETSFRFGTKVQPTSKLCRRSPNGPGKVFGFGRGTGVYTLGEFERRCRAWDVGRGVAGKSVEEIEDLFWEVVRSGYTEVEVEYGSDLDTLEHGSGFPMPRGMRMELLRRRCVQERRREVDDDETVEAYRRHPWNVHNFSLHPRSLLSYLVDYEADGDDDPGLVSGVMVPWLYVGSTFAAFNFHVEDLALYSVNYLHEGAPKVWYCVPSSQSDAFEAAMRDALPELFEAAPDLLSQLVTLLDPSELRARGVDVNRVVHTPGSFVVTMPNSFHGGFNTGFNVAESSNFAALPWLPFSKASVAKYAQVGCSRPVSISHDMLLVRVIERCREHDIVLAAKDELRLRIAELSEAWGAATARASKCVRQGSSAEEADCAVCDADLWLVGCEVLDGAGDDDEGTKMVCLEHAATRGTPLISLFYRYTLDDLIALCD